ncbi:hypothetical protein FKV24_000475 [Lysobacter maris]|uniref:Uncharacterized protein n=1 Tax=Marilutibacter maris TaxID=1605891 RepID=A0A508B8M4_9GAMM|nr:contractile injection system protein, VgrG/Pvc8 family [Lysobacter maris]KAB8198680.1 hypothetical protein FKV24_000475 [Lysobacter maris]
MNVPENCAIPDYRIKVDRMPLPVTVAPDVLGITVLDDIAGPSMFALTLASWHQATQSYTWVDSDLFAIGAEVEVALGYVDRLETVISGEITSLELGVGTDAQPRLLVRGYDRRHRLLRGGRTRTFVQMSDSEIAAQIARDNDLAAQVVDSGVVHEHVWQHAQSDLGFLSARAEAIGYEVAMQGSTLCFRPHQTAAEPVAELFSNRDIESFELRMTSQGQVGALQVNGWDIGNKQAIVGYADSAGLRAMGGTLGADIADRAFGDSCSVRIAQPVDSQDEADAASRGQFANRGLAFILGEGVCHGSTRLRAGSVVSLGDMGERFSGPYYITQARHGFSSTSGYQTTIKVRRNAS